MEKKEWFDKVYDQSSSNEEVMEFKKFISQNESLKRNNFTELEKTPVELKILETIYETLSKALGRLSESDIKKFDINKIHIVDQSGPNGWRDDEVSLGIYSYGHIYVPRNESLEKFTNAATHEMSHSLSFYALDPFTTTNDNKIGKFLRSGYVSVKNKDNQKKYSFSGFNEAVTEFIAERIRKLLSTDPLINEDLKDNKILLGHYSYFPQVWILKEIFNDLVSKQSLDPLEINKTLVSDYVNGTYNFLRLVEKYKKGGAKELMNLPIENEGWRKTAEFFGLDASGIKKIDDSQN